MVILALATRSTKTCHNKGQHGQCTQQQLELPETCHNKRYSSRMIAEQPTQEYATTNSITAEHHELNNNQRHQEHAASKNILGG